MASHSPEQLSEATEGISDGFRLGPEYLGGESAIRAQGRPPDGCSQ
jgi:hypothetical protein